MRFSDTVSGFFNYAYTDGTYDKFPENPGIEDNRLAYLAKNKANLGLSIGYTESFKNAVIGRYVGTRYADARNTDKMDDYITVDWTGRLRISKHISITAKVQNLFDASYEENYKVKQPGRIFLIGMNATF